MGFLLMKWWKTWQIIRIPYALSTYMLKAHPTPSSFVLHCLRMHCAHTGPPPSAHIRHPQPLQWPPPAKRRAAHRDVDAIAPYSERETKPPVCVSRLTSLPDTPLSH